MSAEEFVRGLQNIEREIIGKVREAGIHITADNFRWHRDKDILPLRMSSNLS